MDTEKPPFWLVWNECGLPLARQHITRGSAEDEMMRLAREHPGTKFYVLEPWAAAIRDELRVTRFDASVQHEGDAA